MEIRCPACGAAIREFPWPLPTVDAIIETGPGQVLLIWRRYFPEGWALPGGFVEAGETLEEACRREILEETGLVITDLRQMHTYSDPARDPRRHVLSTVFVARAEGEPRAGDDAARVRIVSLEELPQPMAFDHQRILEDFREGRYGIRPSPPESFRR
jgi:8-oxo-dGTP diphosphatase